MRVDKQMMAGCPNGGRRSGSMIWCWGCYANVRGRACFRGHASYRPISTPVRVSWRDLQMKREVSAASGGVVSAGLIDEDFKASYPCLTSYLTDTKWDDGAVREVAGLAFRVEHGRWNLALNDKDTRRSAYVTASTMDEALGAMERALARSTADWRPWSGAKGKGR